MLTVIKKVADDFGELKDVEDVSETWRNIVGGYTETFGLTDDIRVILNERGKIDGLEPNLCIPCHGGEFEIIAGDVAFVRCNESGCFESLTDDDIAFLKEVQILK